MINTRDVIKLILKARHTKRLICLDCIWLRWCTTHEPNEILCRILWTLKLWCLLIEKFRFVCNSILIFNFCMLCIIINATSFFMFYFINKKMLSAGVQRLSSFFADDNIWPILENMQKGILSVSYLTIYKSILFDSILNTSYFVQARHVVTLMARVWYNKRKIMKFIYKTQNNLNWRKIFFRFTIRLRWFL